MIDVERRSDDELRALMDVALARTWDACVEEAIARVTDLSFSGDGMEVGYEVLSVLHAMKGKVPKR